MNWSILSSGVVCPGGIGRDALSAQWTPSQTLNVAGSRNHETFLIDKNLPEIKRWQREPRLRRASPISCYLAEAAEQALSSVPSIDRNKTGIVASLFLGCLLYSIRFYQQFTKDGRRFASPLLFPETVFNSPLSHVASTLGVQGPVYSQIGDTSCWVTALRTAHCWLAKGTVDHVLVLGAEEFDPHELDAFEAAGLLRSPAPVGEGAGAILLSREAHDSNVSLTHIADGFSFHNKRDASLSATHCLAEFPVDAAILSTATGWTQRIEDTTCKNRTLLAKPDFGIAGTAAGLWNTIFACERLQQSRAGESIIVPDFGQTQQCAAVQLTRI